MHALQVLESEIQQIHQYDWSSGHKKNKVGGLAISSMNFKFGGKGGKELRDTEFSDDSVGDDDVVAMIYESIAEGSTLVSSLTNPIANEGLLVKEHESRFCTGDTQSM